MNRPIKFIAWDTQDKRWVKDLSLFAHNKWVIGNERVQICESTFEFDNHGEEIYEGHIVSSNYFNKDFKHVVKHTKNGFMAGGYKIDAIVRYLVGRGKDFKIIGHILENPELIINKI